MQETRELQKAAAARVPALPPSEADALFDALQNARVVKNAEEYYRSPTWNRRDRHMADTLDELAVHLGAAGGPAKIVVWAHNTHVGDARATDLGAGGEWNIGQLVRQRHGRAAVLVGFTTYRGTVLAAPAWDEPGVRMRVRPALAGSYSALFHAVRRRNFLLVLRGSGKLERALAAPRLERAIGVVYLPRTERSSHYFNAQLSRQFDAVLHFDTTSAVIPLASASCAC